MAKDKPQSTYNEMLAGLGSLDNVQIFHNQLLIGIYMRPEKTAGGIIMTEKYRDEDKWQGKVGAVLLKGPLAFQDDERAGITFQNNLNVGDWAIYRVSDGFSMDINGIHCRVIEDVHIRGSVKDPTLIY